MPCHRGYIGQLEKGERTPSDTLAHRLDEVLRADGSLVAWRPRARAPSRATSRTTSSTPSSLHAGPPQADRRRYRPRRLGAGRRSSGDRVPEHDASSSSRSRFAVTCGTSGSSSTSVRRWTSADGCSLSGAGCHSWPPQWTWTFTVVVPPPPGSQRPGPWPSETDHAELAAWCLETRAWDALTERQVQSGRRSVEGSPGRRPA